MTDRGLAALAEALVRADYLSPNGYPTTDSFAAAILGEHGVFLPDGLTGEDLRRSDFFDEQATTIATLRDALGLLVGDIRDVGPDEPPQRMIPAQHRVSDIGKARLALAEAEETP